MSIETHLRAAGALLLLLASLHPFLPKELGWRDDLAKLSLVNRQIFLVHVAFIVLLLVLLGLLVFCFAGELAAPSRLARAILGGLALFWGLRLVTQVFVYDRKLWRGQRRNTTVHVVAILLWVYLTSVFAWGFWRQTTGI
ncbi:MAG TPA: hypothetical protein VGR31_12005 [Planctomycetota bacterium]|jgi:hypothetical protein|nr:hypothetical protein [Planctomycetota bacterium]